VTLAGVGAFEGNDGDGLERLYRPEALDMPVMVARDAPISTLDPSEIGTFSASLPDIPRTDRSAIETAIASAVSGEEPATPPKVVADPPPGVRIVAVRPAWVRVSDAGGAVVFEGILNGGDTYDVPATEEPPALRVGESGAIYFQVAGQHYGPVGPKGSVTSGLALDAEALTGRYEVADISDDRDLESYVASLEQGVASE